MIKADVLLIGYPRSGGVFLRQWFHNHPQINHDDQQVADLLFQPHYKRTMVEKPGSKVYISCEEVLSLGVCVTGRPEIWARHQFQPGAYNLVRCDVILDPAEAADRVRAVYSTNTKILMVIRDQVSWFASLYKTSISSLPPNQRRFMDYWLCPDGIASRLAAHHDATIRAWQREFQDVLVLRTEQLSQSSELLCRWLGINHMPFPANRENESHAGLASMHRRFPWASSLPVGVKSLLKPLSRFLPGKRHAVLSPTEIAMIREQYEDSNERTRALLGRNPSRPQIYRYR